MLIQELRLNQFRNYTNRSFNFNRKILASPPLATILESFKNWERVIYSVFMAIFRMFLYFYA